MLYLFGTQAGYCWSGRNRCDAGWFCSYAVELRDSQGWKGWLLTLSPQHLPRLWLWHLAYSHQEIKQRASQLVGALLQRPLNCCWSCYCVLYCGIHDSRSQFNAFESSPESCPGLHELSALPEAVYSGIFNCSSVSKSIKEVEIPIEITSLQSQWKNKLQWIYPTELREQRKKAVLCHCEGMAITLMQRKLSQDQSVRINQLVFAVVKWEELIELIEI